MTVRIITHEISPYRAWQGPESEALASLAPRLACLHEASRLTAGDRNSTYGEPVANHQHIARVFNAITGRDLTAREVALFHVATKLARLAKAPTHQDSHIDGMAYLGIAYEYALSENAA